MDRRGFLELSAAIIGSLGVHEAAALGVDKSSTEAQSELSADYLVVGLTGMARARGWFDAHWGAGVLAGYYLCKENKLGKETSLAIKKQLDAMIKLRTSQFAMLPKEPAKEALIEQVPKGLPQAIKGGLRAHGHAVIFASLATRALREASHMAQPGLINGLRGLSTAISRKKPQKPNGESFYADTQAMIEATFDSIARFKDVLGRPSIKRPNFTHMITHTEALMNLEAMGYRDLARAGHAGHRAHIEVPVPDFDPKKHPKLKYRATLAEVMGRSYWENEDNLTRWNRKWSVDTNRNGYWVAFGHLFKVLYSYHRLIKRVKDNKKVQLCSMILLERYLNPDVQGG